MTDLRSRLLKQLMDAGKALARAVDEHLAAETAYSEAAEAWFKYRKSQKQETTA